jgi:TfoX/Sxy family transcriptional regulator of competence genes
MADTILSFLQTLLDDAASDLSAIAPKRMFGCYCLFTKQQIFAAVWKEGRINLRIPEIKLYQQLLAAKGSEPWSVGNKTMAHWIMVPETFHDDVPELKHWVNAAHRLAGQVATVKPAKKAKLNTRTKSPGRKR